MLTSAIEIQILTALTQVFTAELQTAITDSLAMQTIRPWPLQDDPTQVAPYITFGPHPKIGWLTGKDVTIGGPIPYWTYWQAVMGTPQSADRVTAYNNIFELTRRVEQVLQRHYDLANVLTNGPLKSAGGNETLTGQSPVLEVAMHANIFGGDAQFYGTSKLIWRYRYERQPNW